MNPTGGDTSDSTSSAGVAIPRVWTSAPVEAKVRHRTLYFIRHGEAKHNILEKEAIKKAKEDAVAEGFAEDAEETKQRMELARQKILNNESLLDAPLSPAGMKEAEGARNDIERIIKEKELPPPTEVLVSPLQRALQTANIVFPGHKNIKVREEVRERLTGKACDRKTSAFKMARRDTFRNFNMNRQLRSSIKQRARALPERVLGVLPESVSFRSFFARRGSNEGSSSGANGAVTASDASSGTAWSTSRNNLSQHVVEDKHQLRERTRKLFDLIAESNHDVIAVVTHKGFLRELERGPFAQVDATEFKNCEVRVYSAAFSGKSTELEHVERIA